MNMHRKRWKAFTYGQVLSSAREGSFVTCYDQAAGLVLRQHVSEVVGIVSKGVEGFGVRVWYFGLEPLLLAGNFRFVCF